VIPNAIPLSKKKKEKNPANDERANHKKYQYIVL
jgi:hypothetical protein